MLRFSSLLLFLVFSSTIVEGQFYKRFNLEMGVNRSVNYNTEEIISSEGSIGNQIIITNESHAYKNNFSTALGFRLVRNHFIKLRYSKNTIGTYLSGRFTIPSFTFNDSYNLITNNSFGLMYEYQLSVYEGHFRLGIGAERQFNNFDDALISVDGVYKNNYALHSAISFDYPLFKYTSVYSKIFILKSFHNNYNPPERSFGIPDLGHSELGSFVPLQIGVEVGLRFCFD